jgi:glycosyltransferase involved in cell wall biosynthesis
MMNCPKHIGLVGPLPPPFGGMANQTRQLAELLRGEGVKVSFVQTNAAYRPHWIAEVKGIRAFFRLAPYLLALWRLAGCCQIVHLMANSGWSWHLFAAPAIWICKLRNTPIIINYRGGEAAPFLANSTRTIKFSMDRASALIVPSGFLKAVFARFGIPSEIVPNVVDVTRFHNPNAHRIKRRKLLVARNLELIYDNESAIRAFLVVHRKYPDATLTIAGSGPLAEPLRTLANALGIAEAIRFSGRLDRDAMAQAYLDSDITINPSLVDNMPNSILESLACGIPVVSTNVGGVPFIVNDGQTALLVPPKSPDAMAEAILCLMDDAALSKELVENGLAEVQKYTWQHVWPVLANIYCQHARRLPA